MITTVWSVKATLTSQQQQWVFSEVLWHKLMMVSDPDPKEQTGRDQSCQLGELDHLSKCLRNFFHQLFVAHQNVWSVCWLMYTRIFDHHADYCTPEFWFSMVIVVQKFWFSTCLCHVTGMLEKYDCWLNSVWSHLVHYFLIESGSYCRCCLRKL